MLEYGFEFGGVGGAVGGLCCVIQHHLLLTCPEGLTIFYTDCILRVTRLNPALGKQFVDLFLCLF